MYLGGGVKAICAIHDYLHLFKAAASFTQESMSFYLFQTRAFNSRRVLHYILIALAAIQTLLGVASTCWYCQLTICHQNNEVRLFLHIQQVTQTARKQHRLMGIVIVM